MTSWNIKYHEQRIMNCEYMNNESIELWIINNKQMNLELVSHPNIQVFGWSYENHHKQWNDKNEYMLMFHPNGVWVTGCLVWDAICQGL